MKRLLRVFLGVLFIVGAVANVGSAQDRSSPSQKQSTGPAGFHLVLLLAQNGQGSSPTDLPAGAAKALKDASSFLPFRSYALLDSALIRGVGEGTVQAIRLQGPSGEEYVAKLTSGPPRQPKAGEWFVYIEVGAPVGDRTILKTAFTMQVGETVIVGTSKVKGQDQAVIVLLTALKSENLTGKKD